MKRVAVIVAMAMVWGRSAGAQQAAAPPVQLGLDLGFVNTAGNTDVTTFNFGQRFTWSRGLWAFAQAIKAIYGETDGQPTAEAYDASLRADYRLTPRLSVFALGTYQRNPFAGIASRWGQGGGLAWHVVRAVHDSLTVESSVAANQERSITAASNTFASLRGALAYKHVFGTSAFLTQALEWITDLARTDDQRLNSETALTAPLSRQVALKAAYVIRYDREPEPGFETTDRIFTTGVQIVF